MKKVALILVGLLMRLPSLCQQEVDLPIFQQQLENLAEQQDGEPEDDSYLQLLTQLQKNQLDLNSVEASELTELRIITAIQAENLVRYRKLLGKFISIYELQAVPGWDVSTIRKALPYVRVGNAIELSDNLKQRFANGQHTLLLRLQQVLEKSNGYLRPDTVAARYPGSPVKAFFRYKYNFRNLLQFGVTGEKDAGEQFLKGNQRSGFDFYSVHLFARKIGVVKSLAIGDFSVNMGQGLIQWQSLAFKKTFLVTNLKRQSDVLKPYNSSGEYNFMRGCGVTIGLKNISVTAFASFHRLDANINTDTSQTDLNFASSVTSSGYHRTATEVAKRNAISQTATGASISLNKTGFHVGFNAVAFNFSSPLNRTLRPYNQFAFQGKNWFNYSVDYAFTWRNFHFFGEAAVDKKSSKAIVASVLASLDRRVEASLLYRNIERSYQTLYGNAFTESTSPSNEKGLFTGISVKPLPFVKIDAYADVFSFPWLRFRVDAPTTGSEYLVQLTYSPNKQTEIYTRFKTESKATNLSGTSLPFHLVFIRPKESWRTHIAFNISRQFSLNQRVEVLWFDRHQKDRAQQGFLMFAEGTYRPLKTRMSLNSRLQYFETGGFDSRIYAFERDVLYSYSIPEFSGKGLRYYINFNWDLTSRLTVWYRWAQTVYSNRKWISSGLDKIEGNKRSEVKLQILYNF